MAPLINYVISQIALSLFKTTKRSLLHCIEGEINKSNTTHGWEIKSHCGHDLGFVGRFWQQNRSRLMDSSGVEICSLSQPHEELMSFILQPHQLAEQYPVVQTSPGTIMNKTEQRLSCACGTQRRTSRQTHVRRNSGILRLSTLP